jgi:hypothetical protein
MLDSVNLESPVISEEDAQRIEAELFTSSRRHNTTGELVYALTNGPLKGSWDHRFSLQVLRHRWEHDPDLGRTVKVPSQPFLRLEGSIHKAMVGHNVYGGPEALLEPCQWLLWHLVETHNMWLPIDVRHWYPIRIDWAEAFDMGSFEAVQQYIRIMASAHYPQRSPNVYGDETILWAGRTTALKLYHKGPEFRKHDLRRLQEHADLSSWPEDFRWYLPLHYGLRVGKAGTVMDLDELEELTCKANATLRCEVAIKRPKLEYEYGSKPKMGQVKLDWVKQTFDTEVKRIMKLAEHDHETVRRSDDVLRRLEAHYSEKQALAIYSTWSLLATHGKAYAREHLKRSTYYDHQKKMAEVGVEWKGSDLHLRTEAELVPADFIPLTTYPTRRIEHPRVMKALEMFRAA